MKKLSLFLIVFLLSSCSSFLFIPYKSYPFMPGHVGISHDDIFIEVEKDVKLHGWKLHADGESMGSIIFFHGNGDNVSTQLPNTFWLVKEGYDVYVFDYREYGQSQGEVELDTTINDMESMIAYVVKQLPVGENLIVIGHSLGGSMAIHSVAHSAYRDRIKALVTIEAFSDYRDITQDVLSTSWLFWLFQWPLSFTMDNSYRPLDAIGSISPIPVLILHSERDEIIDMYHAEELYKAAKQPKSLQLIDSDHSNTFINIDNRKVLLDYLSTLK